MAKKAYQIFEGTMKKADIEFDSISTKKNADLDLDRRSPYQVSDARNVMQSSAIKQVFESKKVD